ncbi:MAG: hypothetical protein HeimC3_20950 [Candidatus Heimdallarchaeota archaeon LC_3]|nr:MAG: hypothetical protein HeimC3_20950 [Candidatus Heimdallarchaeota archaeon LC_3]
MTSEYFKADITPSDLSMKPFFNTKIIFYQIITFLILFYPIQLIEQYLVETSNINIIEQYMDELVKGNVLSFITLYLQLFQNYIEVIFDHGEFLAVFLPFFMFSSAILIFTLSSFWRDMKSDNVILERRGLQNQETHFFRITVLLFMSTVMSILVSIIVVLLINSLALNKLFLFQFIYEDFFTFNTIVESGFNWLVFVSSFAGILVFLFSFAILVSSKKNGSNYIKNNNIVSSLNKNPKLLIGTLSFSLFLILGTANMTELGISIQNIPFLYSLSLLGSSIYLVSLILFVIIIWNSWTEKFNSKRKLLFIRNNLIIFLIVFIFIFILSNFIDWVIDPLLFFILLTILLLFLFSIFSLNLLSTFNLKLEVFMRSFSIIYKRYLKSVFIFVLTVTITVFAASTTDTISQMQTDELYFQNGGDIFIDLDKRTSRDINPPKTEILPIILDSNNEINLKIGNLPPVERLLGVWKHSEFDIGIDLDSQSAQNYNESTTILENGNILKISGIEANNRIQIWYADNWGKEYNINSFTSDEIINTIYFSNGEARNEVLSVARNYMNIYYEIVAFDLTHILAMDLYRLYNDFSLIRDDFFIESGSAEEIVKKMHINPDTIIIDNFTAAQLNKQVGDIITINCRDQRCQGGRLNLEIAGIYQFFVSNIFPNIDRPKAIVSLELVRNPFVREIDITRKNPTDYYLVKTTPNADKNALADSIESDIININPSLVNKITVVEDLVPDTPFIISTYSLLSLISQSLIVIYIGGLLVSILFLVSSYNNIDNKEEKEIYKILKRNFFTPKDYLIYFIIIFSIFMLVVTTFGILGGYLTTIFSLAPYLPSSILPTTVTISSTSLIAIFLIIIGIIIYLLFIVSLESKFYNKLKFKTNLPK